MALAPPKTARIGFRRDVRIFFGSLVGFLSPLILILLLLLQGFLEDARDAAAQNRANVVRMIVDDVEGSNLRLFSVGLRFESDESEHTAARDPHSLTERALDGDGLHIGGKRC